ncbi:MAG: hypothetical protein LBI28_12925 [Treponema sp.]|jgi:hypothetical protein|nr:hypothetical protein [Treponema sp.]
MIQLYFLSVLCNGLSGYVLFAGNGGDTEKTGLSLNNPTFHLVLGILSAVTGILKILAPPLEGDIPIIGDLIPAAAGIIAGLVLIFGIYRQGITRAPESDGSLDRIGVNLLTFRKPLGLALLAIAFVHFLLARTLFL